MDALALPLDDEPTLTVGELGARIDESIRLGVPGSVWVRGEVSQLRASSNGHAYFQLVEKDGPRDAVKAVLGIALFRKERAVVTRALDDAGVALADGVELRVRGRVDFYPPQGRVQLIMNGVDPVFTVGQMAADRSRVLRVLAAEGLLDRNGRHELPAVPLRVGLVTSGGSAAYHDFVHELEASGYAFRVTHCDARVQGAGSERRIAHALRRLAGLELDAVVLVRGGGARTDLRAFDTEVVARAIAAMPVPVLTGIGHEIDRTVADEVAHTCAKTPTAAAGVLVAQVGGFADDLRHCAHRLAERARAGCGLAAAQLRAHDGRLRRVAGVAPARELRALDARRRRLVVLARTGTRDGARVLRARERGIVVAGRRVTAAAAARLLARAERVAPAARHTLRSVDRDLVAIDARIRALDPRRVLERGYSITRDAGGRVVRSAATVAPGGMLETEFADGVVTSRITGGNDE
ncbi:MAG: exodeoxyribonuclease VII large subunit [Actinomycetota bacterium]